MPHPPKNMPSALARVDTAQDNARARVQVAMGKLREAQDELEAALGALVDVQRASMDVATLATDASA